MTALPYPIHDRYYRYNHYLRQLFGEKVYRISLDAGFSCPTRDGKLGTGGCLYCNNRSFSRTTSNLSNLKDQIIEGIKKARSKKKADKFLAYFQAYTNTYAPVAQLEKIYRSALEIPGIVGIVIGTRPDCIDSNILDLLQSLQKETYISVEFGLESVYNKTLQWARRGHDFSTTKNAIAKTISRGIHTGVHIIFGFPTESRDETLNSAKILNQLRPDALKIHHLHIVKGSGLAPIYKKEPFPLFNAAEWVQLVCDFLERLEPGIVIQRLVGDARPGTLIAPHWNTPKSRILEAIQKELENRNSYQGYRVISGI